MCTPLHNIFLLYTGIHIALHLHMYLDMDPSELRVGFFIQEYKCRLSFTTHLYITLW